MSAFDDLTLGEVEEIQNTVLAGKTLADPASDPMMVAGAVMWITRRREEDGLTWDAFKARTKMSDIKAFSIDVEASEIADPTYARPALTS